MPLGKHFGPFVALNFASMNEEPLESPLPAREPLEEELEKSTEKKSTEEERTSEAAPTKELLEPSELDQTENPSSDPVQETAGDGREEAKAMVGEPPVDWFEPLEEDDDVDSINRNDPEEESVAGESERSESMAGSEKAVKKFYQ